MSEWFRSGCGSFGFAKIRGRARCRGPKSLAPSINVTDCATQATWPKWNGHWSVGGCHRDGGWDDRGKLICAKSCRRSSTFCPPDASGGPCRRNFRRTLRYKAIFTLGATAADGTASSRPWSGERDGSWVVSQSRRLASSTAKQLRRPRPEVHAVLIPASASTGASATSLPIPMASC